MLKLFIKGKMRNLLLDVSKYRNVSFFSERIRINREVLSHMILCGGGVNLSL